MIISTRTAEKLQKEANFLSSFASTIHGAMVQEFGAIAPADCQNELANRLFEMAELLTEYIKIDQERIENAYRRINGNSCVRVLINRQKITVNQSALELVAHLVETIMTTADDKTEQLSEVHALLLAMLNGKEVSL